jgi:hypothetical protein
VDLAHGTSALEGGAGLRAPSDFDVCGVARRAVRLGCAGAASLRRTKLRFIEPGSDLPGGIVVLYDGRGRNETPLWLPKQKTIVFADALTAPGGELRVWASPAYQERALPALGAMLELPFERVIVSHGEPVHGRVEFERALKREPWRG